MPEHKDAFLWLSDALRIHNVPLWSTSCTLMGRVACEPPALTAVQKKLVDVFSRCRAGARQRRCLTSPRG